MGNYLTRTSDTRGVITKRIAATTLALATCIGGLTACNDKKETSGDNPVISNPSSSAKTTASAETDINITVTGGKAEGGLRELKVAKGSLVKITVTTTDTTNEVHVHGYDILKELSPTTPAVIMFTANISGVFEVELEKTSVKIADLTVK